MEWQLKAFRDLTSDQLYKILKARVDVFVVEQACPYPEIDNFDQVCTHLFIEQDGIIVAYSRLIPANTMYAQASIGRVLVHKNYRQKGLAKALMEKSIAFIMDEWQEKEIKIHGQEYLRNFYGSLGFEEVSDVYLEDNIPHVDMILHANKLMES
ncbi:GNAT family N-acetyltransferase [Aquibacillus sediminis]|uniref:GNAT family N-acetyltransferase n=1 Tax=Aquibacillus sediminis TaxID=2574734 RepID=UPI0011082967|nr:GNAT family N-acetyltransferase [Aquibacillus sediminis]